MAELYTQGEELVLSLTGKEKILAVHGDVRVPLTSIATVEVLDNAYAAVKGIRLPGASVPGLMAVGTFRHKGTTAFAVVHHGHPRGIRVRLQGADYDELIIGSENPEELAATLAGGA